MENTCAALLLLFLGAAVVTPALAEDLLIVQSLRSRNYQDVVRAARAECKVSTREVYLTDIADVDVPRMIRESRAKAVLALGDKAFRAAMQQRRVPVIGALTLETRQIAPNAKTIPYLASPQKYLLTFKEMGKKLVGVVYDGRLSHYVAKADRMARNMGIHLVKKEVNRPEEVAAALTSMQQETIDSLWVVPDTNVVTAGTVEPLLKMAAARQIPAIIFSETYLKSGAVLAIEPDRRHVGKQAGELACTAIATGVLPEQTVAGTVFVSCGNRELGLRLGLPPSLFSQNCNF